MAETKELLAGRREQLSASLGPEAVMLLEAVSNGGLPGLDILDDAGLGAALRKAVEAGFQMSSQA